MSPRSPHLQQGSLLPPRGFRSPPLQQGTLLPLRSLRSPPLQQGSLSSRLDPPAGASGGLSSLAGGLQGQQQSLLEMLLHCGSLRCWLH